MNTLEFHILSRLGSEREVLATDFRDCHGTLALLVQQGLIEQRSSDLGDYLRITQKGRRETVTVLDSFSPDLTG
ncbi:hypothetical protein ATO6_23315 [Oceanicola sp. 22II-s10i]|uniref:hypothetical protein n=1 Tax=Oceanicola sp. 22II-s10i TaxID=1317116 RepID=UPI000B51E9CA|nr:hypothetical protein [Oceanicola sp. 22II-s10i]OWU81741.1 hypothetical protein ATO6_23315 [Oceanicola sp. 22II-s10i]